MLFEQDEEGVAEVEDYEVKPGFSTIKTPSKGKATYIPIDAKITKLLKPGERLKFKNFSLSEGGNEDTNRWVDFDWSTIFEPDSVLGFETSDGKKYFADFGNKITDKIYKMNISDVEKWRTFYETPIDIKSWYFKGYFDQNNSQYIPPKKPETNWWTRNWEWVTIAAATIIVAIATAGQSLWVQSIAMFGVDVAYAAYQLLEKKDHVGAAITLLVGLIPIAGRAMKFGTKAPLQFLAKYGNELKKISDSKSLELFYKGLDDAEKVFFTRIVKQTPNEAKKFVNDAFITNFKKLAKEGKIDWAKIPHKERLWWKTQGVEPVLSIASSVGGTAISQKVAEKKQTEKQKEKWVQQEKKQSKMTEPEKQKYLEDANTQISKYEDETSDF